MKDAMFIVMAIAATLITAALLPFALKVGFMLL